MSSVVEGSTGTSVISSSFDVVSDTSAVVAFVSSIGSEVVLRMSIALLTRPMSWHSIAKR